MRRAKTKRHTLGRLHFAVVALGLLFAISSPLAYAIITRPYFKVFGADVFTGGWFYQAPATSCASTKYQDPLTQGTVQPGGTFAYTRTDSSGIPGGGASSQFGAFSLGLIDGMLNTQNGFYSSGATGSSNNANWLSFANDEAATVPFGGKLQGSTPQGHCIPDYYGTKVPASPQTLPASFDISTLSGSYFRNSPTSLVTINSTSKTISPGRVLTIFINGNAYIGANIVYSGTSTAGSVPKFALVVQGSIFIAPGVTQLDGLYVAQPDPNVGNPMSTDTGVIWTCRNNTTVPTLAFLGSCTPKLIINGALIAKQVNFLRSSGNVATAAANEVPVCSTANPSCATEVVNYTPAMVIGGPFFDPPASSGSLKIQSLVSLPPVF